MEQMLHSAGALLIQALPTFFVVVLLHWYLKSTLFQPLEKVLEVPAKKLPPLWPLLKQKLPNMI